ncbi:hypothetical protein PC128_g5121 [Phytophthora cactorum]|nr:hypothetical protein PC128_g5121 [Phytophthora cactorum]
MGSHVPMSSGFPETEWLSVASHKRLSMGSHVWSSGSSQRTKMKSWLSVISNKPSRIFSLVGSSGNNLVQKMCLLQAVALGFPHVVERELPEEVDAVESEILHAVAGSTSQCRESADMIERGFLSSAAESASRPVSRRGSRKPRRPRTPSECSTLTETEVISVLVKDRDARV